jgi:hypothetical protein
VVGAAGAVGDVGAGVAVGETAGVVGAVSSAWAGTALPMRPKDSRAAHRSRAGEGKVKGFSSGIRAFQPAK